MSDLTPPPRGPCVIRVADYHPCPGTDGLCAQNNGRGKPVIVAPGAREWDLVLNEKTGRYTIRGMHGSEGVGFSWDGRIHPESLVIVGKPQEFTISMLESFRGVGIIRPVTGIVGVDICVGVNDREQLEFRFFSIEESIETRPAWCFTVLVT